MKNLIRIFVLLMIVSVLFCGCGDADTGNRTDPTGESTTAPTESSIVIPTFTSKPADNGKITYTVTILDQNGNPVEGVTVQFCDAENCKLPVNTDANGVVTGTYAASEYHITLVELPDGYTTEETEFFFGNETELTIMVTAE